MADRLTPERRSWNMSRIRGSDTSPERTVRSLLHRLGFRFTLKNSRLPGKPDIVMPRWRTVVFVHGCFWHRHQGCDNCVMPETRTEFWREKLEGNVVRDDRNTATLLALGWNVLTIWECETADEVALRRFLTRSLRSHS
jgi:DNA mismatch endonuclease (patch repair protein)